MGARIRNTYLERAGPCTEVARIGSNAGEQLARDALPAERLVYCDFEYLQIPIDDHTARIADDRAVTLGHPPRAVLMRQLVGDKANVPSIRPHGALFQRSHVRRMPRIKRVVRYAAPIWNGNELRELVHRCAANAPIGRWHVRF